MAELADSGIMSWRPAGISPSSSAPDSGAAATSAACIFVVLSEHFVGVECASSKLPLRDHALPFAEEIGKNVAEDDLHLGLPSGHRERIDPAPPASTLPGMTSLPTRSRSPVTS